jgi:hypothetical protein
MEGLGPRSSLYPDCQTFRDSVLHFATEGALIGLRTSWLGVPWVKREAVPPSWLGFQPKNPIIAARKNPCQLLFQSFLTFYALILFRVSHRK